jgi:rare lipoprotein A
MNHKLWKGITTAVMTTAISTTSLVCTSSAQTVALNTGENNSSTQDFKDNSTARNSSNQEFPENRTQNILNTKIYPHQLGKNSAATLHLNNIPILTFLGNPVSPEVQPTQQLENSPLERAKAVADIINQLNIDKINGEKVTVDRDTDSKGYTIKIDDEDLVTMDENTILPDSTKNLSRDALQATNRLRRLLGGAAPLRTIPQTTQTAFNPYQNQNPTRNNNNNNKRVVRTKYGMASWYGPGFHGRRTASGQRFNQNALTAAHRTLPFGTLVRVTNVRNGQSVVVRINDRGPFSRGRVIDLSAGAARAIGSYASGVAPVKIDVLGL